MPIDYSKYPDNWKDEIVPAVLERAGNCCEQCGLPNKTTVWSVKFDIRKTVNGRSRYQPRQVWFRIHGDAVREAKDRSRIKEVTVVLTVAHLDHDEDNHDVDLDRLRALCQACHLRYDADEKYRRMLEKAEARS